MERTSRELGLFQQDTRNLPTKSVKLLRAFAWIVCQLKRFNREELKLYCEFCDGVLREREANNKLDLSTIVIDEEQRGDLIEISEELLEQFNKK